MAGKPSWAKSDRFERSARFAVDARAEEVFPLLCPVREYEWIPDWSCEMIWSKSGVAERDATFRTKMHPFGRLLWTCIAYEPPRRIEYLMTLGSRAAVRLEISLDEGPGGTEVGWTMRFTAAGGLRRRFDETGYATMIEGRRRELAEFLASREPIRRRAPRRDLSRPSS
ncbi:MAG: SRPBCC family protein [Rectinemataceae bacterium]